MNRLILAAILSLLSTAVFPAPELKGSPQELKGFLYPNDKIVTITGYASEKAYSDKAIISLIITTEDELLSQAIASNGSLRDTIERSLVSAGIDQESIKSSKFSSSPQYGWFGRKPSSFKIINRMAVSITDESQLKEVAAVADELKEVELADTAFEHTKKDEFNEKMKAMALEKILKRKDYYEKTLGVQLTPVGIRESDVTEQATRGAYELEEIIVSANSKSSDLLSTRSRKSTQQPSFDEVEYEATMLVDFKIENE